MGFGDWKNQKWFPYTVASCSGVLLYVILMNLSTIGGTLGRVLQYFSPVVIGCVLAYIMEPFVIRLQKGLFRKIKKKKLNRLASVVFALTIAIVLLTLILVSLIPQLIGSITMFLSNFDTYLEQLQKWLESFNGGFLKKYVDLSGFFESNLNSLIHLESKLPEYLEKILGAFSAIGEGLVNWVMGAILAVYFLFDKDRICWGWKTLVILITSPAKYKRFFSFLKSCNDIMEKYIIAELVEALVVGSANFIFMLIFGMPYAVLVSVVVGITNMIPTFGPIFGAAVGGLILLLADPWKAVAFLIFTAILQTLDGYVLKPKMYGDALGVSPVMILVFIIVGGKMFGVIGILIAIPLAAILSIVISKFQAVLLERKAIRLGIDDEDLVQKADEPSKE